MSKPKGTMLLIGGAEDKGPDEEPPIADENKDFHEMEILEAMAPAKKDGRVEVITTATSDPDGAREQYTKAFHKVGVKNIGFLDIETKMEAREEKYIERIKKARGVFITGGDQFRVSTILGGTPVCDMLREKYQHDEHFIVGGTSAGAMALTGIILAETTSREAMLAGHLHTAAGLGLLERCIVDTHFIKRGRFGRMAHALVVNPMLLGIGLGEDTAMLIKHGTEAECLGSGMMIVIDAKGIEQTNIMDQQEGHAIFVENLRVDLLIRGCRYSLKDRKLHRPAIAKNKINHDIK